MNIKRQCSMVKTVSKNIKKKEKGDIRNSKKADKFYRLLNTKQKTVDELHKEELSNPELELIKWGITDMMKQPMTFYPNLI